MDRGFTVPVAINVSGKDLLHGDPARVIRTEAAAAGVPASLIEVEITESLLVKDSAAGRNALKKLRELGCRIALDDFGTGYSALAYITRFPPDRIKIDKAFVRDVDRSASDAAIANAILSLGQSLGTTVTAEGIERSEEHTSELQSRLHLVCRLLLEKKKQTARHSSTFALDRKCAWFPVCRSLYPEKQMLMPHDLARRIDGSAACLLSTTRIEA